MQTFKVRPCNPQVQIRRLVKHYEATYSVVDATGTGSVRGFDFEKV